MRRPRRYDRRRYDRKVRRDTYGPRRPDLPKRIWLAFDPAKRCECRNPSSVLIRKKFFCAQCRKRLCGDSEWAFFKSEHAEKMARYREARRKWNTRRGGIGRVVTTESLVRKIAALTKQIADLRKRTRRKK